MGEAAGIGGSVLPGNDQVKPAVVVEVAPEHFPVVDAGKRLVQHEGDSSIAGGLVQVNVGVAVAEFVLSTHRHVRKSVVVHIRHVHRSIGHSLKAGSGDIDKLRIACVAEEVGHMLPAAISACCYEVREAVLVVVNPGYGGGVHAYEGSRGCHVFDKGTALGHLVFVNFCHNPAACIAQQYKVQVAVAVVVAPGNVSVIDVGQAAGCGFFLKGEQAARGSHADDPCDTGQAVVAANGNVNGAVVVEIAHIKAGVAQRHAQWQAQHAVKPNDATHINFCRWSEACKLPGHDEVQPVVAIEIGKSSISPRNRSASVDEGALVAKLRLCQARKDKKTAQNKCDRKCGPLPASG